MKCVLLFFLCFSLLGCQHSMLESNSDKELKEIKNLLTEIHQSQTSHPPLNPENVQDKLNNEIIPELQDICISIQKNGKLRKPYNKPANKILIGRVEWVELENTAKFKARVDTGAQTNSLHAINIQEKEVDGEKFVEFQTQDFAGKTFTFIEKVVKKSIVKSTSGSSEKRYVVKMNLLLGNRQITTNVNLNDRSLLKHNFLIGRNLLIGDYIVDVSQSRLLGGNK